MIWLGLFIAMVVLILGGWYLYNQNQQATSLFGSAGIGTGIASIFGA
jgi:hypothetical protein